MLQEFGHQGFTVQGIDVVRSEGPETSYPHSL